MFLFVRGRRLHFDLLGPEDTPVVCLTHSLAADGGMWAEQVCPLLTSGYRVLRLDMRGHGGSDPVCGEYTLDNLATDVLTTLDMLGFEKVHYIGLSIGGMIGQAMALKHGGRLASMMLCDTQAQSLAGSDSIWGPRLVLVRKEGTLEGIADGTIEKWLTPAFRQLRPGRWKQLRETIAATTVDGYAGAVAALKNFNFVADLPSVRVPTIVVYGSDDPSTTPAHNQLLASLMPGCRSEQIAGARHFPNVECPEPFNRIMLEWLNSRG